MLCHFSGESGCGKSTVIAHWLKQFTSSHPHVVTISHFVGCDSGSNDITNFMRRCTSELRLQYLESDTDDLTDNQDLSDFTRVTEAFRAAISLGNVKIWRKQRTGKQCHHLVRVLKTLHMQVS